MRRSKVSITGPRKALAQNAPLTDVLRLGNNVGPAKEISVVNGEILEFHTRRMRGRDME